MYSYVNIDEAPEVGIDPDFKQDPKAKEAVDNFNFVFEKYKITDDK